MESNDLTRTATDALPADDAPTTTGGLGGWLGVPADATPGRVAGYVIEGKLGQGGMGVVFKAVHPALNRPAAVKRLLAGAHAHERDRVRFLAEAEAMAAVRHPHVVGVYDFGSADGQPFLAMEYLAGGSLHARLGESDTLPPRDAAELVGKVADGVAAAHDLGIVHRDLKPGNILLDDAGEPKVTDFGLAKRGDHDTASHAVMGTVGYMAPEQARGQTKNAGPAADVYALGAVLFRCLAGRPPFVGDDGASVLLRVIDEDAPSVSSVNRQVPRDLALIVARCLEKDPRRRYPDAGALAADLGRFRRGEPVAARPVNGAQRVLKWARRRPYLAGLSVALALSLLIGTAASTALAIWAVGEARRADREAVVAVAAAARADAQRAEAEAEAARANQVTDALADLFRSGDPLTLFTEGLIPPAWEADRQKRRAAEDLLRDAAAKFRTALADQPLARGRLLGTAGASFRNLGLMADARPLLAESLALRRQTLPADHPEVAEAELELGRLHLESGDYAAAQVLCRDAAARLGRVGGHDRPALTARLFEGVADGLLGRPGGVGVLREVVAARERLDGPTGQATLLARLALAAMLLDAGRAAEAVAELPGVLAGLKAQPPGQLRTLAEVMAQFQTALLLAHSAGGNTFLLGRAEKQLAACDAAAAAALPARTVYRAFIRFERANLLFQLGRLDECDGQLRECLADVLATCGLAHPKAFLPLRAMAQRLAATDRRAEARGLYARAEEATVARFGAGSAVHTLLLLDQTAYEAEAGQYDAAAAVARQALATADRLPPTRAAWHKVHDAGGELRDGPTVTCHEPAVALLRLARRLATAADGPDGEGVFLALRDEADQLRKAGRHQDAADALATAQAVLAKRPDTPAVDRNILLVYRGRLEADRGDFAAAEGSYRAAAGLSRGFTGKHAGYHADDLRDWAGAVADQKRFPEAVALLERAVKAADKRPAKQQADLRRRLAAVRRAAGDAAGAAAVLAEAAKRSGPDAAVFRQPRPVNAAADPGYPFAGTDWLDRLPP